MAAPRWAPGAPLSLLALAGTAALVEAGAADPGHLDLVFALCLALTLWRVGPELGLAERWSSGGAGALAAMGIAGLALPDLRLAPYLGVAVGHLAVAAVFLRGVMPGRTPVLLQFIEHMGQGGPGSAGFRRFVRRQGWVWAGLMLASAAAGLVGMVAPGLRAEAGMAAGGLLAAQIAWFVLTHRYATWRYARPETWRGTLRAVARPDAWSALRI